MEVGVRDLKTHLSAYLERVRSGETVIVTTRGKPVARLAPDEQAGLLAHPAVGRCSLEDTDGTPFLPCKGRRC